MATRTDFLGDAGIMQYLGSPEYNDNPNKYFKIGEDPRDYNVRYRMWDAMKADGTAQRLINEIRARDGMPALDISKAGFGDNFEQLESKQGADIGAPLFIATSLLGGAMNGAFSGVGEAAGAGIGGAASGVADGLQNFYNPGMQLADAGNIVTDVGAGYGPLADASMMPAAQVPSPAQYAEWGMKEVSPGVWTQGGAPAGTWQALLNGGGSAAAAAAKAAAEKTAGESSPKGSGDKSFLDKVGSSLITGAASAGASALLGGALSKGGTDPSADAAGGNAQIAEQDRKAKLRSRINQLYGIDDGENDPVAKAARDSMGAEETKLGDATRSFYDEQLQHDTEKAFRNNRFALADRGTLGGSAQIDTEKELSRDNTLGATRVADQVANAVAGLKSSREQERLNATSLVNAGSGEDAVQSAQAGLTRSLQNANATQHANITGDLFTSGANSVSSANSGYNPLLLAQYQNKLGSFFNPSSGSSARSTAT